MGVDRYNELAQFSAVAQHGSLARAATALGVSASQVSRTLTRLEKRLGVRLAHRTTRRVTLTAEGRSLAERTRALLAELDQAESAVGEGLGTVRGTLRVTLPVLFGHRFVAPIAARFVVDHPLVALDLSFEDRRVDLVEEGYDLGVRIGLDDDPTLVARRLATTRLLLVASPDYLARTSIPADPSELGGHEVLLHTREAASATWTFGGNGRDRAIGLRPSRFIANNGLALREAALHGLGLVRLPDFMVAGDVAAGTLIQLLPDWEPELAIAAVYPPGRRRAPKVRAFVEALTRDLVAALPVR